MPVSGLPDGGGFRVEFMLGGLDDGAVVATTPDADAYPGVDVQHTCIIGMGFEDLPPRTPNEAAVPLLTGIGDYIRDVVHAKLEPLV